MQAHGGGLHGGARELDERCLGSGRGAGEPGRHPRPRHHLHRARARAPDDQERSGPLALRGRVAARHCPSVDALFHSVATSDLAPHTVAALLTGMGNDGAQGLHALRRAGAWTIAQDEPSCVVYGMPKAAVQLEAACEVLPLDRIGPRICAACEETDPRSSDARQP
ncbi:MAG: CheB methylesterase domain-containing protein [Sandaracinaceae bacterium]|nr:CheB methylesterase domain-containing protein [Sandaracinaceae bacterium]